MVKLRVSLSRLPPSPSDAATSFGQFPRKGKKPGPRQRLLMNGKRLFSYYTRSEIDASVNLSRPAGCSRVQGHAWARVVGAATLKGTRREPPKYQTDRQAKKGASRCAPTIGNPSRQVEYLPVSGVAQPLPSSPQTPIRGLARFRVKTAWPRHPGMTVQGYCKERTDEGGKTLFPSLKFNKYLFCPTWDSSFEQTDLLLARGHGGRRV